MAGLSNTYTTLMGSDSTSGKGLTLDDLTNVSSTTMNSLGNNMSFLQYLTTNFKTLDNDGDGEISSQDMNNLMSTMQSKGLTYNELQYLCTTGNGDTSLLSTVLTYFNKIDKNLLNICADLDNCTRLKKLNIFFCKPLAFFILL